MAASHHSTTGILSSKRSLLGAIKASFVAEDIPVLRATDAISVWSCSNCALARSIWPCFTNFPVRKEQSQNYTCLEWKRVRHFLTGIVHNTYVIICPPSPLAPPSLSLPHSLSVCLPPFPLSPSPSFILGRRGKLLHCILFSQHNLSRVVCIPASLNLNCRLDRWAPVKVTLGSKNAVCSSLSSLVVGFFSVICRNLALCWARMFTCKQIRPYITVTSEMKATECSTITFFTKNSFISPIILCSLRSLCMLIFQVNK